MRISWIYGVFLLGLILGAIHCANPIAPQGGPKDETPPQIDSTKSTPNFQTNFEKQRIEITFDEWIKLNDPSNQILISPPLQEDEDITLRGKSIRIEFDDDEVLKDSVTYTINFGEAIQDITESNQLLNYRFVFSTGSYIDSLMLDGVVIDSQTEQPVESATIMLYEDLTDSVIYNELPIYFGKTNEEGQFQLENLKSGTYKAIVILEEGFSNYKYDPYTEKIGFLDQAIRLPDTTLRDVHFYLFVETQPLDLVSSKANRFSTKLIFNRVPEPLSLTNNQNNNTPIFSEYREDTLILWHREIDYPFELYIPLSEIDTVTIQEDTTWADSIILQIVSNRTVGAFYQKDSVSILGNQPILTFDSTRIYLTDTAGTLLDIDIVRSTNPRELFIKHAFVQEQTYELVILPQSIQLYHGEIQDTVITNIKTADNEIFAIIKLELNNLDSTQQYIVQILKSEDILLEQIVKDISQQSLDIRGIRPGNYEVKVIEDRNRNGQWDTGDYLNQRYPEKVSIQEIANLKANWEMNVTFNWQR